MYKHLCEFYTLPWHKSYVKQSNKKTQNYILHGSLNIVAQDTMFLVVFKHELHARIKPKSFNQKF